MIEVMAQPEGVTDRGLWIAGGMIVAGIVGWIVYRIRKGGRS